MGPERRQHRQFVAALGRSANTAAPHCAGSIFVADDGAEVHLTTMRQESPRGSIVVASVPEGATACLDGQAERHVQDFRACERLAAQGAAGAHVLTYAIVSTAGADLSSVDVPFAVES